MQPAAPPLTWHRDGNVVEAMAAPPFARFLFVTSDRKGKGGRAPAVEVETGTRCYAESRPSPAALFQGPD
jgi:hypothetical protein